MSEWITAPIECMAEVSLVSSRTEFYEVSRKSYMRLGKKIQPKPRKMSREIPVDPYLFGEVILTVYADLPLRGRYEDENRLQYFCITIDRFDSPKSTLRSTTLRHPTLHFRIPIKIKPVIKEKPE